MGQRVVLVGIRWLHLALLWIGAIAVALSGWYYFDATHYQAKYEQAFERLERERLQGERSRAETSDQGAAASRARPSDGAGGKAPDSRIPGDLLGRLEIARIDLRVMVLDDADATSLRRGAGWIDRTARPGSPGNLGIAGHRDTHFRRLERVRKGDQVVLTTMQGRRTEYRVDWIKVVDPAQVEVLNPTPGPAITLVTCYPFDYIGRAPKRFVVRGVLVAEGAATSRSRSTTLSANRNRASAR